MSIYVAPRPPAPVKAGPIGSGAGVLLTEYPLFSYLGRDPATKMRTAYNIGWSVPWVRLAENVIGTRVATVDFDLDDPDGNEIDATCPNPDALAAWSLLNKPQALLGIGQPMSRSSLWRLTSRHTGLAGNGFWLQDQPEVLYGTPKAIAYIRPDRMSPNEDANGNLRSWFIDKREGRPGIEVSLEQVIHFMLEPPDSGHFSPGLVESALLLAQLSTSLDKHLASVLSAGGRLSGFVSPKQGQMAPEQMTALERDWRTITEQPDAAKRLQLIAAPVEFTHTTMTPEQLAIVELMKLMRDELLIVWNVPGGLVGVPQATGLNGGESRKYDDAALWQGPVHDRLQIFREAIEDGILPKFGNRIGWTPDLVIEEPEFDDDSPRYDLLGKSITIAMRNRERRELIGLDPLGPDAINPATGQPFDDEVWMPITQALAFSAPSEGTPAETMMQPGPTGMPSEPTSDMAMSAAGETSMGKATLNPRVAPLRRALLALRDTIARNHTPRVKEAVAGVLQAQRADIAARIRGHAAHLKENPKDSSVWWDGKRWDQALTGALITGLAGMATSVSRQVADALPPAKAEPLTAVDRVLTRGAARVTKINQTTKDEITAILAAAVDADVSLLDVADALEAGTDLTALIGQSGGLIGDLDYRAEMIARTELMDAYNASALYSYGDAGVTQVQAIDGDGDDECAARDGQTFDIEEADSIEDHPNGTLDWVPVLDFEAKARTDRVLELVEEVRLAETASAASSQRTLRDVAKAMASIAERPAEPVVITPPAVHIDTTAFAEALDRLSAAFRSQPAPVVNVTPTPVVIAEPKPRRKVVHRDEAGQITEVTEE